MAGDNHNKFVRDLLHRPREERLAGFRAFTAKHPLLLQAFEELWCAIRDSDQGSIIFVYGPAGVGKTTLLKGIKKRITEVLLTAIENDPERIPVAIVQLETPTSGNFNWKDYFKRLLIELEEPLVDHKVSMEKWSVPSVNYLSVSESNMQLLSNDKTSSSRLRFASEQTLRCRKPLAVLLDDAQYLGIIGSGRKLLDQLNTIKSIADRAVTTHCLCGTYELIPLRNLNGQLSRRSIDINFGRYNAQDEEQRQAFVNVLFTFQEHLPLVKTPDLVSMWDYFYERSIGCVGILKDWLTRSLSLALENDSHSLTLKHLEHRALSVSQCSTLLREAVDGERELQEKEEARAALRKNLGLESVLPNREAKDNPTNSTEKIQKKVGARHYKRRVGTRNPVRDKVGRSIA
jgi:energy-coupling factor transporter ATP-binding protein EcfA2